MDINVDTKLWQVRSNAGKNRHQTLEKQLEIQKQVEKLLENKVVSTSKAEYYSQVHLTPKPLATKGEEPMQVEEAKEERDVLKETSNFSSMLSKAWRFCNDFRALNAVTEGIGWTIPRIPDMLQRLGNKKPKILGKFDLTNGYWQAPLAKSSRVFTAFITHMGVYEWNRAAMGLKGAGPWFQSIMASIVLVGLLYFICELYMDDVIVHAATEEEFVKNLDSVLTALEFFNVTVNPDKPNWALPKSSLLDT